MNIPDNLGAKPLLAHRRLCGHMGSFISVRYSGFSGKCDRIASSPQVGAHKPLGVVRVPPFQGLNNGDVLFQGSIGRTDFPRGDYDALIRSIQEELLPLGDDVTFLPGHGPVSTFGEERRSNPFLLDPDRYRKLM